MDCPGKKRKKTLTGEKEKKQPHACSPKKTQKKLEIFFLPWKSFNKTLFFHLIYTITHTPKKMSGSYRSQKTIDRANTKSDKNAYLSRSKLKFMGQEYNLSALEGPIPFNNLAGKGKLVSDEDRQKVEKMLKRKSESTIGKFVEYIAILAGKKYVSGGSGDDSLIHVGSLEDKNGKSRSKSMATSSLYKFLKHVIFEPIAKINASRSNDYVESARSDFIVRTKIFFVTDPELLDTVATTLADQQRTNVSKRTNARAHVLGEHLRRINAGRVKGEKVTIAELNSAIKNGTAAREYGVKNFDQEVEALKAKLPASKSSKKSASGSRMTNDEKAELAKKSKAMTRDWEGSSRRSTASYTSADEEGEEEEEQQEEEEEERPTSRVGYGRVAKKAKKTVGGKA